MSVNKVLSVRPPWAQLIVKGIKPVENRIWNSNYRGKLLIHCSKKWDCEGALWIVEKFPQLTESIFEIEDIFSSGIIGSVDMIDCVKDHYSLWFSGPYGFVFENAVEFDEIIPCKGKLGIFNFEVKL